MFPSRNGGLLCGLNSAGFIHFPSLLYRKMTSQGPVTATVNVATPVPESLSSLSSKSSAGYDLTPVISQYLDRHLVFPLLEFLDLKKVCKLS